MTSVKKYLNQLLVFQHVTKIQNNTKTTAIRETYNLSGLLIFNIDVCKTRSKRGIDAKISIMLFIPYLLYRYMYFFRKKVMNQKTVKIIDLEIRLFDILLRFIFAKGPKNSKQKFYLRENFSS